MIRYVQMTDPELLAAGRYTRLMVLAQRCEATLEFQATCPADVVYPRGD
jgi:hypothetical protein